ncbi:CSC1-like protein At4g02900 isoform X2 [Andrographis paniculata]|uniref:CSC1-like protein At4g02900 isoform X2 n=1 Tax=Andrographis paniculata TaxID=175694 RepID=UPI0021E8C625|nr:CSC1-like protein At4g02900 isoform X2 [Andrographis paniculata]
MANIQDIATSAFINTLSALAFLLGFAFLRLQPINDRVYFSKWYRKGIRAEPKRSASVKKFVNLDFRAYLKFWTWMPEALRMPEPELIDHAGLDSVAYIRIYLLGLKIFVPIAILSFAILFPVNWFGETLKNIKDLTYSNIDKLSIANVPSGSKRLWAHVIMAYVVSLWTFYVLYKEYQIISTKRLQFLAGAKRRPDQFSVLVRNIPPDPDESVSEHVEHFFCVNHPDYYLMHQVLYDANNLAGLVEDKKSLKNWLTYYETRFERNPKKRPRTRTCLLGLFGKSVDAIDYYKTEIEKEAAEREKVINDPKAILPAAFVSFKSRWGAAVCAQTQQAHNPTLWLTEWAPEPRDVFWNNLAIPYVSLSVRRLIIAVAMFFFTFFFMIPIALVQSLASIDGIQKVLPFLKSLIQRPRAKSFIQGFLPGLILKIFMALVPQILMAMSKIEGHISISSLERRTAGKYHLFVLVNVFLGSIVAGAAFQQLRTFINQSASEIPKTVGVAMPMKATFFITYIMVDGWAGVAAEVIRLVPLVIFHLKNTFLVKTELDREEATDPGSLAFYITEPRTQLYFLLGLVYSVVTPIILPFIIVFFAFAYVIYRHQIINVYDQKYESAGKFWPDVHRRVVTGLVISQFLLLGLLNTKDVPQATPILLVLPVLSMWFYHLCKGRFESIFMKFPLQDAMMKDTIEKATEGNFNLKGYLKDAYVHPVFKDATTEGWHPRGVGMGDGGGGGGDDVESLVATTRAGSSRSHRSKMGSEEQFSPV